MTPDAARLQHRARSLLPAGVYDYYAGGSGRERTLRASEKAWQRAWLAPRVLRDVSAVDTGTALLGTAVASPVCVAPTAFHRLAHPDGEAATAAGAARAGALYVLSTRSTRTIEDVAEVLAAERGAWWFQVYIMRDRDLTAALVARAAAAGAAALVLTADTPVVGRRRRNGDDGVITDEDVTANLGPVADLSAADQADDLTFADIGWLSSVSGGLPVVVKGVLRGDDARACRDHGAAAVIVSSHGGRQLDGALPPALALPGVTTALADAGGQRSACGTAVRAAPAGCEVYVDGGVRTGENVLAALAMGAAAVFIGRPVLWALACDGADGVRRFLAGLTGDLAHCMALAGAARITEIAGLAVS